MEEGSVKQSRSPLLSLVPPHLPLGRPDPVEPQVPLGPLQAPGTPSYRLGGPSSYLYAPAGPLGAAIPKAPEPELHRTRVTRWRARGVAGPRESFRSAKQAAGRAGARSRRLRASACAEVLWLQGSPGHPAGPALPIASPAIRSSARPAGTERRRGGAGRGRTCLANRPDY